MQNILPSIKGFKELISSFVLFIAFTFVGLMATAQTPAQVSITVNIIPPYSPYYSDYSGTNAGKVLLIVRNLTATQKRIKLTGELTGNNGIRISTKSTYVPLQPIILQPNETKQLNGAALKDIFDLNSLNVYGIDKVKLVQTSRLPEGDYTFCLQAVDMNTNQVITNTAPQGCTIITIAYPEAPILISPMVNNIVFPTTPQNIVFNWMNAGFVPMGTQYKLQVAEMPLTREDPNQVLNSTSFPLVNKIIQQISYVLSPSDPPLKVGRRYAWRVQAIDPSGKVVFRNNGISKANEFRYGGETPSFFTLNTPQVKRRVTNLNELVFYWNFTENAKDVGFFDGITSRQTSFNGSKYELHLVRVKTPEEKKADSILQANTRKSSAFRTSNIASTTTKDPGVVVPTNNTVIAYKTAQQLKDYLKDANSYEWYIKHISTGTVSETRQFAVKYEKAVVNYVISLAGDLKYNFYKDYNSKKDKQKVNPNAPLSEEEKGYALGEKNIQVIKVTLLAPKFKVNRKVTKIVNGQQVSNFEMQDSIALVSDLLLYPYGVPKLSASAVIASGTTNALGNFKINVPIEKAKFKVLDSNAMVLNSAKAYALVEGLVIRVNDSRFSDPNWFIVPDANKTLLNLEEQTVEVYGYNANVKLASSSQRDFKGKLYLLRNNNNLLKGEVANIVGVTKEIPTYTTMTNAKGKKIITGSSLATYTVVGLNNIDAKTTGELNSSFSKLAVAGDKINDGYTVYFEPADEQDGLFFNPRYVSNGQGKANTFTATNFANRNLSQEVSFAPQFISMKISGRYVYHWKDAGGKTNNKLPLPEGTSLTLVKGNMVGKDFFKDGTVLRDDRIIASTTVKKNGEYSFDIGLTDYNDFNKAGAHLVILVSDTYYYSEPYTIEYNQNETIKMPELTATVRQYDYISKVGYMEAGKFVGKDKINVYLCRKMSEEKANTAKYVERPINIGDPDRNYFKKTIENNGEQYEIIDMTTSAGEGKIGEFRFKRLIVSRDASEKYYIIAESSSTSQDNYVTKYAWDLTSTDRMDGIKSGGALGGVFTDDQKIGTSDFNIGNAHVKLTPLEPYVDGAVYPNSNTSTSVLSGVFVELFDMTGLEGTANNDQIAAFLKDKKPVDDDITQTNGRFLFENVNAKASGWKLLRLTKKGFLITYTKLNSGKPFVKGQRGNLQKIFMDLPANLSVFVVNKAGNRVSARVIVGDDFSWGDYNSLYVTGALVQSPINSVRFTIIPSDRVNYKTTTQYQTIQKPVDENSLQNISLTVNSNEHEIYVSCKIKGTNQYLANKVVVLNTSNFTQRQTSFGNPYTVVTIPAAGTQFELKVVPDNVNYTIAKTKVISDGTTPVNILVEVEPAATLTIKATEEFMKAVKNGMFTTFEKTKIKSSNFGYFVEGMEDDEYELVNPYGNGPLALVTLASTDTRILRRLPADRYLYIGATKQGYVGDRKYTYAGGGQTMAITLDLKLSDLAIKDIHGFPVELTEATKLNNGQYQLSGRLNPNVGNNGNLKATSATGKLDFKKVLVDVFKISGRGTFAAPVNGMTFAQNSIDAKLFDKYDVKITSKEGLSLKQEREKGSILGKVALDLVSFSKGVSTSSSDDLGDKNYLYLNKEGASYALITSFPADKTAPYLNTFSTATSDLVASNYIVSTHTKEKPVFYGADDIAIKPEGKVMLTIAGMEFMGAFTPNLEAVAVVNPAIAKYKLSSNDFISSEEQPFNIKLRDWELKVETWKYGAKGLFVNGKLFTNGLTVPFDKLQIFNNKIGFGNFNVTSLKVLGTFPVTINGSKAMVSFGYDRGYSKERGAWSLSVLAKPTNDKQTYLAGLKGLDDLLPTDVIQIKNINLYDTGNDADTRLILDENQPAVTLNTISKFKPGSIWGDASSVTIRGDLNMEIPGFTGLDAVVYDLVYRNENGVLKHKHEKTFKNVGLDTKGMLVKFSEKPEDQKFNGGTLFLRGVLMDKDPKASYQIDVDLTKNKDETKLEIPQKINGNIPRVYLTYNTDYLNHTESYNAKVANKSENYLNGANGLSIVSNNQWTYFTFNGDLTGASGINPSPMSFTIKGDVVANSANVGVQNMDAGGVQGLSIVYDFKEKALMGSGHVNQVTSFATMDLDLEMKLGSSNWYMFANGTADIEHSPFTKVGVGFMVGNSTISPSQKASFYKHFDGRDLPDKAEETFGSVKGIILILSAEMPIPKLPQFDLPLDPVAKIELKHGLYATAYFKADFPSDPKKISFTIGGRVGAFVKISAGASIGLACAGISLGADFNFTLVGKVEPFVPSLYASATVELVLKGEAYVGAGICNASCQTPCWDAGLFEVCSPIPCVRVGLNKQVKVSFGAEIKNTSFGAKDFKVDFF